MSGPAHDTRATLGVEDAVFAVDVQRDFCPGGRLPVEEGDAVVPLLNDWIAAAERAGSIVVLSRDWHPPGHVSFEARGGPWPDHCVRGTEGARLHPGLRVPGIAIMVSKGMSPGFDQYSAFDRTGLASLLRRLGVRRVWIGGLTREICVRSTALDAVRERFETHVLVDATRPIERAQGERALADMQEAGVKLERGGGALLHDAAEAP